MEQVADNWKVVFWWNNTRPGNTGSKCFNTNGVEIKIVGVRTKIQVFIRMKEGVLLRSQFTTWSPQLKIWQVFLTLMAMAGSHSILFFWHQYMSYTKVFLLVFFSCHLYICWETIFYVSIFFLILLVKCFIWWHDLSTAHKISVQFRKPFIGPCTKL